MQTIETERRESSSARVPSVSPGKALVYTRYAEDKTVVMNPEDFHRLLELDHALAEISSQRPEMTGLVLHAHRIEDEPGEPIEDGASIKRLLGI